MRRDTVFSIVLTLVGLLVGIAAAEAAYRAWLFDQETDRFRISAEDRPNVWFFETTRWHFNAEHGFEYGPETVYGGSIVDGLVRSCWSWPANERGNMGLIEGDYETADLKVLVFGDSFTAQVDTGVDPRGVTWPDYFQRSLAERTGRSVHVVNFGRDGYGILQMADLAADV
ncbi:MAG: SGNH/GDSL hydrolase family protein, partial [Alphaproteobacteria bacterium]|nr:SGNH/GDSL hydrolase family protein [Alphaproteobacteria bacterium]